MHLAPSEVAGAFIFVNRWFLYLPLLSGQAYLKEDVVFLSSWPIYENQADFLLGALI